MILIADAHITQEREQEFFEMLEAIAGTQEDLLFLGDIFDIWIPFPQYEKEFHRRFLEWCSREKTRRRIVFLEGNHEFHIQTEHREAFTATGVQWSLAEGVLAFHGENTALSPLGVTRIVLAFIRSDLGRCILRWTPGGPWIARFFKRCMAHNPNKQFILPQEEITKYLMSFRKTHPFRDVILGHYHNFYQWELPDGGTCTILPAWFKEGTIARYPQEGTKVQIENWRTLLKQ